MDKLEKWMFATILICGTTALISCTGGTDNPISTNPKSDKNKATDYSVKNNWMRQPVAIKDVDAFFVYPTRTTILCTTIISRPMPPRELQLI
jgi:hypothetical protein